MIFLHRSWLIVVASSVKFTEYWLEAKDSYRLVVDSYDFNRKISRIMRPLAQSFCTKLGSTVSLSRANSVRLHSLALGPGHDMRKPIHLLSHPGNISLVFLCFPHKRTYIVGVRQEICKLNMFVIRQFHPRLYKTNAQNLACDFHRVSNKTTLQSLTFDVPWITKRRINSFATTDCWFENSRRIIGSNLLRAAHPVSLHVAHKYCGWAVKHLGACVQWG